jgi:RimJ/RimL family protein N-acetyltransferase
MDELLQEEMLATIRAVKDSREGPDTRLPAFLFGRQAAWLVRVADSECQRKETLARLTQWHRQNVAGGPSLAASAVMGPVRWLTEQVLHAPDRLLFWVQDLAGNPIGHAGISGIDSAQKQVEIGYILRGVPGAIPGAMYGATQALIGWAFRAFRIGKVALRIFPSNRSALCLADRCGFAGVNAVLAARHPNGSEPAPFVTLILTRSEWMDAHRVARAA